MVLGANLHRAHLDKVMGAAEFISISSENFFSLKPKANGQPFCCFYKEGGGEIIFSEKDTKAYFAKLHSNSVGQNPDYNEIFENCEKKITLIPSLYFEEGSHYIHFSSAFLFE